MTALHELASGGSFIYVASRVFDFAEKLKTEALERAVKAGVTRSMQDAGITPNIGAPITFVPFRDTTQSDVGQSLPEGHLTRKIYHEDIERLHRLSALVCFFDGLSKDEGICMEIGYAFGINKPVLLAITDFVRTDYKDIEQSEHLVDPVLEVMATKIIYEYKISQDGNTFEEQLRESLRLFCERIQGEVYLLGLGSREGASSGYTSGLLANTYDVYIDFGGGLFEWQRSLQERLAEQLCAKGLSCVTSQRYWCREDLASGFTVRQVGERDLRNAQSSSVIVICSDSIEMNSGTAAIQGFSRALNKKILLYDSKSTSMVADYGYRSSRNLMIDHSATKAVSCFSQIGAAVREMLVA